MKPIHQLAFIFIITFIGSFAFTCIMDAVSGEDPATAQLNDRIDTLNSALDKLLARNRKLNEEVRTLGVRSGEGEASSAREPMIGIEEAMDRWIRRNRPDLLPGDGTVAEADEDGTEGTKMEQAANLLALLDDPDLDDEGWNDVWKKTEAAGLIDEALALLEENVANDPTNPDNHVALAGGYIGKTMNTTNDMEKGIWAIKADKALDQALELDPYHWDARFTKAMSLTFYPPVMGKQGEAMKHFEILLDQQKSLPPNKNFAQTYLFLGNLHMQMGNHDKASQIWKEGLGSYPNSAELAEQLKNALK